jgi:hypothetical protein
MSSGRDAACIVVPQGGIVAMLTIPVNSPRQGYSWNRREHRNPKFQAPNPKLQTGPAPRERFGHWDLGLWICLEFGLWDLGFPPPAVEGFARLDWDAAGWV